MRARPAPRSRRRRYLDAVLIVTLAIGMLAILLSAVGTRNAFLTFYPAVVLAAVYGGLGPALLATIRSAVESDHGSRGDVDRDN